MKIQLDARERQILKSDSIKVFTVLTALAAAYAHYYPFVSHFIPPKLAAEIVAAMGAIGWLLRFRPQAQIVVDVLDGDKSIEDGVSELLKGTPLGAVAAAVATPAGVTVQVAPAMNPDGTPTAPVAYQAMGVVGAR